MKVGDLTDKGRIIWMDNISEYVPDPLIKVDGCDVIKYRLSDLTKIDEPIQNSVNNSQPAIQLIQLFQKKLEKYKIDLQNNPDSLFHEGLVKNTQEFIDELKNTKSK